jgi:CRP-like cAMP-binding protein
MSDSLWVNLLWSDSKREDLPSFLRSHPLFAGLKEKEISELCRIMHERTYQMGEIVFCEGEMGAGMYLIWEGRVRIYTLSSASEEIELARLGRGDFFGEIALLDDGPRTATAVATEPTRLLGLMKPDLLDFLDRHPNGGIKIILRLSQVLAARLRHTNEELRVARYRPPSLAGA